MEPLDLARLCQRAEREFVGMPCGIMDQYISVFGRAHMAVEIDCRSLGHRDVQLPGGITFLAVNTMVKHALAGSAYQDRVRECAAAVSGIQAKFPEAKSLRDVSVAEFESVLKTGAYDRQTHEFALGEIGAGMSTPRVRLVVVCRAVLRDRLV